MVSRTLLALALVLVAACNGVSVSGASDEPLVEAGPTVKSAYSPDASDAGAPEATANAPGDVALAPAPTYQGSPLCNSSHSTGCCYPDDPANPQACAQAACQTAPDGGSLEASGAYVEVALGCHVVPVMPSTEGSAGSPSVGAACLPGGQVPEGFSCSGPQDCAPSFECVGAVPACHRYCCEGNEACPSVQFCDIQPMALSPQTKVPVCLPVQPCTLLSPSCPANETCAVVRDDGTRSCVAIGGAHAGESCETDHCAAGLVCLGTTDNRSCYVLCHTATAAECSAGHMCQGGLPLFPDPEFGICQ